MQVQRVDANGEAKGWVRCASLSLRAVAMHPGRPAAEKKAARVNHFPRDFSPRPKRAPCRVYCPQKPVCIRGSGVSLRNTKASLFLFTFSLFWFPWFCSLRCPQDEGEKQKCGEESAREGKRRVFGAGQAAAAALGHHQSTGQSVHHPPHHQLPQNATRLSWWWVHYFFISHIIMHA